MGYGLRVAGSGSLDYGLWNVPSFERETKAERQVVVFLHRRIQRPVRRLSGSGLEDSVWGVGAPDQAQ